MEYLSIGKFTNADLADWFGTSESNLSHKKKKFLAVLKEYCAFNSIYGGIEITEVYNPFYTKNANYKLTFDNYDKYWSSSGLDTCTHVGSQMYADLQEQYTIKESTVISQTRQVRNQKFHKPFDEKPGPCGKCTYILCKKNEHGQPTWLSDEENQIKEQLLKKYFGTAEEKTIMVQQMVENGEITADQAWDEYSALLKLPKFYPSFMSEFKKLTGVQLIRGTLIDRRESAFEEVPVTSESTFEF